MTDNIKLPELPHCPPAEWFCERDMLEYARAAVLADRNRRQEVTTGDGGPAFPATEQHGCNSGVPGMSLRDVFAISGLHGLLSNPRGFVQSDEHMIARDSYAVADAMIAARGADQGGS